MTKKRVPNGKGKAVSARDGRTTDPVEQDSPRFHPGHLNVTEGARGALAPEEIQTALHRHTRGDWGELHREDWAENERALAAGEGRLFSLYRATSGATFYVITEPDWMTTTVLLSREY